MDGISHQRMETGSTIKATQSGYNYQKIGNFIFLHITSRPKCMPGSRDPGVTIVNPTEISVIYGYVT